MADEKKQSNINELGKDAFSENSDPLVDENKAADNNAMDNEIDDTPLPIVPSITDDYKKLTEMNLFKAVLIKFQRDAHPKKDIDSLLNRRISIRRSDFEGPFIVRVISSILMVLTSGTIAWIILWLIGSALGETNFLRELAAAMATMIAAIFGIALFQPFHLIDEKALKLAISEELLKLKCLIEDARAQEGLTGNHFDQNDIEAEGSISVNTDPDSDEDKLKSEDTLENTEENTEKNTEVS